MSVVARAKYIPSRKDIGAFVYAPVQSTQTVADKYYGERFLLRGAYRSALVGYPVEV